MIRETDMIFREVQKFRQPWLWLVIVFIFLLIVGLFGWGMIQQLVFGKPWGDRPLSDTGLLIAGSLAIAFGMGLLAFFYNLKLVTEVRSDGLYFRFFLLFSSHMIPLDEIKRYEVQTCNPIKEYGGWGIRYGPKGKAYNVSGNRGVQLELSDGKRILIGSQKPEEFAKAIDSALRKLKY